MPVQMQQEGGNLVVVTLRGLVTPADHAAVLDFITETIARVGAIRLLVLLEGFRGWTRGGGWDADALRLEGDEAIAKTAIVGEPRWKDEVFAFIGQPFRKTPIDYFAFEEAARAWLAV